MSKMKDGEEVAGGFSNEETDLPQLARLVDSLVSISFSVKLFPGKWQSIRGKLEQLSSRLITAAASGKNPELAELLRDVTATMKETQKLALCCADESYSSGKLIMMSNLDIVTSKLELHIKGLTGIYDSGILTQSHAIVASKPGVGASRDDMRFYVKDLSSRLKIGDTEMKSRALMALNEILLEDEKYVRIVAMETADIFSFLVSFLESSDQNIQEGAAESASTIAGFNSYKSALAMAGVIAPLIRVLEIGSELGRERAAKALKKLTENSDNAWSVSANGGVTVLLRICEDMSTSSDLIGSACCVLKNLVTVSEIRRFMVEEGAVLVFLKLSGSKDESTQIHAMEFLQTLANHDDDVTTVVIRERGIESLVRVLNTRCSSKTKESALRAIENFCISSKSSINVLLGSGFLHRALFFLKNGDNAVLESALKALSHLCEMSEDIKKAMGDAGFMPELIRLIEAKSSQVRELSAQILSNMVLVPKNRRKFIQDDHNLSRILQLLGSEEEKSITKKYFLFALMSLSDSSNGRKKIAASGYVRNLEKLAVNDVPDAKKILKRLSTNRILSILNVMWS